MSQSSRCEIYVFKYVSCGRRYSLEIPAYSEGEALRRVRDISGTAEHLGIKCGDDIPAGPFPVAMSRLLSIECWLRNTFTRVVKSFLLNRRD